MEKKQKVVKDSKEDNLKKMSPKKNSNKGKLKPEMKNKKIQSSPETQAYREKIELPYSDSFSKESVEKKEELKLPKTPYNVTPIDTDEIPPITPIKLETYFKYINSQYLKNGDLNLDKDININFSKYFRESGSIGTILKRKNTLDMVAFIIFLNDAFKKNQMENFGKIIIILLRILFPDIKTVLTNREEKEILDDFNKYNIEIKNEHNKQTVWEVTYEILKKFKAFLDIELLKSKNENNSGTENNIFKLVKSATIFEPYFARINAIYEQANSYLKVSEKLKESTIKSPEKIVKTEKDNSKTSKDEMMKKESSHIKNLINISDLNLIAKNPGDNNSAGDYSPMLENIKGENINKNKHTTNPDPNVGKMKKIEETTKNHEQFTKRKSKTALQIARLRSHDPERGMFANTSKSQLKENDKKCVSQVRENPTSGESEVKMTQNKPAGDAKYPKSMIIPGPKEKSLIIEEIKQRIKNRESLFVTVKDTDDKNFLQKKNSDPHEIFNYRNYNLLQPKVTYVENYCILPITIICEIISVSFKNRENPKDKLRISKFSNPDKCRYDLRYGGHLTSKKYLEATNLQKIFKYITEDNIMSLNKMRIEKLSKFYEINEKPSHKELDCKIINGSESIEKIIDSKAFIFHTEMMVKLISREKGVLVSLITIPPKDMEGSSPKAKSIRM